MSTLPEDLKSKALETPNIQAAVVCPNQESILSAVIEGKNMNLIDPTLIGNKSLIAETAKKLSLDISNFNIVEAKDEEESASVACQMSNENKSKIIIKGNLHTDILMRSYLKKEFNLLDGRRLSHIWHMTTPQLKKPLFITDGALNVLPRVDIKLQILKNAVQFCNKLNINKPKVAILSGTEDPIESMPSSVDAKKVMELALEEKINEVKAKVDVMNQFKLPANPTFNTLTASSVNTSAYTYNTNTCTQQVTNDVQDSYSFTNSLVGGKILSIAGFDGNFSRVRIYEQGGTAQDDYLEIQVSANGQTSMFTSDASGSEGNFNISADGDLTLKCANSKSIVFNQGRNASGAHLKSNFINPFIASAIFG